MAPSLPSEHFGSSSSASRYSHRYTSLSASGRSIRSSGRSDRFKTHCRGPCRGGHRPDLRHERLHPVKADSPRQTRRPAIGFVLFYLPAIWVIGSIFSALLLLIEEMAGGLWQFILRPVATRPMKRPDVPADPERRHFLKVGVGGLAAAPFILSGLWRRLCRQGLGGAGAHAAFRLPAAAGSAHGHPCRALHDPQGDAPLCR